MDSVVTGACAVAVSAQLLGKSPRMQRRTDEDSLLASFRQLQRQLGAQHLGGLNVVQLGLAPVQQTHHISPYTKDSTTKYRVRVCRACTGLETLIDLGLHRDLDSALLLNDCFELLNRRTERLHVLVQYHAGVHAWTHRLAQVEQDAGYLWHVKIRRVSRSRTTLCLALSYLKQRMPEITLPLEAEASISPLSVTVPSIASLQPSFGLERPPAKKGHKEGLDNSIGAHPTKRRREQQTASPSDQCIISTSIPPSMSFSQLDGIALQNLIQHSIPLGKLYHDYGFASTPQQHQQQTELLGNLMLQEHLPSLEMRAKNLRGLWMLPGLAWEDIIGSHFSCDTATLSNLMSKIQLVISTPDSTCLTFVPRDWQTFHKQLASAGSDVTRIQACCTEAEKLMGKSAYIAHIRQVLVKGPRWRSSEMPEIENMVYLIRGIAQEITAAISAARCTYVGFASIYGTLNTFPQLFTSSTSWGGNFKPVIQRVQEILSQTSNIMIWLCGQVVSSILAMKIVTVDDPLVHSLQHELTNTLSLMREWDTWNPYRELAGTVYELHSKASIELAYGNSVRTDGDEASQERRAVVRKLAPRLIQLAKAYQLIHSAPGGELSIPMSDRGISTQKETTFIMVGLAFISFAVLNDDRICVPTIADLHFSTVITFIERLVYEFKEWTGATQCCLFLPEALLLMSDVSCAARKLLTILGRETSENIRRSLVAICEYTDASLASMSSRYCLPGLMLHKLQVLFRSDEIALPTAFSADEM